MEPFVIYIICIFVFVLFLICLILAKKVYDYSIIILKLEDAIEKSLDILDEKYGSMNEVLQKPIFFDSMEVRQVISDIRDCHNAVLLIANILTKDMGSITDEQIKEENS